MLGKKRNEVEKFFHNLGLKIGFVCQNEQNNDDKSRTKINYFGSYFTAKKVFEDSNGHVEIGGIVFHVFSDQHILVHGFIL